MKNGFTLAEVLITLGIIGVVAALSMPSLIAKHQEKQTVVKLKKTHSILSQSYNLAVNENGSPENWDLLAYNSVQGAKNITDKFLPYLKITKLCEDGTGCFPDVRYTLLNGSLTNNINRGGMPSLRLNDGTVLRFVPWSSDCKGDYLGNSELTKEVCGAVGVDINGKNGPNRYGVDYFEFVFSKKGVFPRGIADSEKSGVSSNNKFSQTCSDKNIGNGYACAAWVIFNENMDYLHCNDLSWDGKTKCK